MSLEVSISGVPSSVPLGNGAPVPRRNKRNPRGGAKPTGGLSLHERADDATPASSSAASATPATLLPLVVEDEVVTSHSRPPPHSASTPALVDLPLTRQPGEPLSARAEAELRRASRRRKPSASLSLMSGVTIPRVPSGTSLADAATPKYTPVTPLDPEATYVAAIDQGTSSTRFVLIDNQGNIVRVAQQELKQIHVEGKPGWAEHDPLEILSSIQWCIQQVLSSSPPILPSQVVGIGITNQRETTVAWDRNTGQPLHNALVWHDTRTADIVTEMTLKYTDGADHFRASAGLPLSTYFSALKMRWLMQNVPAVADAVAGGECMFGTIDTWIIWNLSGGAKPNSSPAHVTDVSNASRTLLMNLQTLQWDEDNCNEFGVPVSMLPTIRSNSEVYTTVFDGPLKGVPIAGCVGDQQSAMIGQLCFNEGQAKSTYGTGLFLLLNTGHCPVTSSHGLLTTVAFQLGREAPCTFALEGSVAVAGSGVRWLRDEMRLIKDTKDINALAAKSANANDVYFVPAFSGLLSPYWRDDARGIIAGLTHSSNNSHLARAVLYSSAYQAREVFDAMLADTGGRVQLTSLQVDGGMCASDILMQFQADMLSIPVCRPASLEATASGAAFCAGLAVGFWPSLDHLQQVMSHKKGTTRFLPHMLLEERERLYHGWKKAVQRTLGWVEQDPVEGAPQTRPMARSRSFIKPLVDPVLQTVVAMTHPHTPHAVVPLEMPSSSPPVGVSLPTATAAAAAAVSLQGPAAAIATVTHTRRVGPVISHILTLGVGLLLGVGLTVMRPKKA